MGFGASHVSFQILAQPLTSHLTHKACPNSRFPPPCRVGCNFPGVVRHEWHQRGESIYLTPNWMAMLLSKLKICRWRCREMRTPCALLGRTYSAAAPVEVSMVASQNKAESPCNSSDSKIESRDLNRQLYISVTAALSIVAKK